jgi:GH43 family beta-xylosidase
MALSYQTYQNPLTSIPSADPFVLKHGGEYWAYVTGVWQDGRSFGILHSNDLVTWEALHGAIAPLEPPPGIDYTCYWAPEVNYENGLFYLYYSVGDEKNMHLRVAVSENPAGPFVDSGHRLTSEQFAIDGHVFVDDDGSHYLFYAADFLEHTHIGTGIVVDRMLDPYHLAGQPRPAARARYDWQVYDPNRAEKGGVRWHTVEGPFVLKRRGRYYLMFSGGNWQNDSYGLAYAVSDRLDSPGEWEQPCDGIKTPPILKSNQAQGVIGPGHNSVVRGPDNRQRYCVYHRWNESVGARVIAIDPLEWIGDRLTVLGPSTGQERIAQVPQLQHGSFADQQIFALPQPDRPFLAEVTVRPGQNARQLDLGLTSGNEDALRLTLGGEGRLLHVITPYNEKVHPLPADFRLNVDHLLRIEVNGRLVSLQLNGVLYQWNGIMSSPPTTLSLRSDVGGAYRGFALTPGWEDTFEYEVSPAELGWREETGQGSWLVQRGSLQQSGAAEQARVFKRLPFDAGQGYQVAINARLVDPDAGNGSYQFYPAASVDALGPIFSVRPGDRWELRAEFSSRAEIARLPDNFDPYQFQHFRFQLGPNQVRVYLEDEFLIAVPIDGAPDRVGLGVMDAQAAFDLVRVTL